MQPHWTLGAGERRRAGAPAAVSFGQDRRRLRIGLVNNMPDAALIATERQFRNLLEAAAPERSVELHLFHIPAVSRGAEAAQRLRARYRPVVAVERAGLDALIVTGAEPRAADLRAEPFWPALASLVDWAADCGVASLWSCLAAHAAVLHRDGVRRRPLPRKCSGLFACLPAAPGDPLLRGCAGPSVTPHSRSNALDEEALARRGYTVLSRSPQAGVDSFVRREGGEGAPMLFLQGHPEYEPASLPLEFRRDLQRFLSGEREVPPELPEGVFGEATTRRLQALVEDARLDRRPELMERWPGPGEMVLVAETWRAPAAALLRNWLGWAHADAVAAPAALRLSA